MGVARPDSKNNREQSARVLLKRVNHKRTENDQPDGSGVRTAASITLMPHLSRGTRTENREAKTRARFTSLPTLDGRQKAVENSFHSRFRSGSIDASRSH